MNDDHGSLHKVLAAHGYGRSVMLTNELRVPRFRFNHD
jgi:hypothetical protein